MAAFAPYATPASAQSTPVQPASAVAMPDEPADAADLFEHEPDDGTSEVSPTMMTIATVDELGTRWGAIDAAATRLAQLAVTDELVVVYGSQEHQYGTGVEPLVVKLRDELPRHTVVVLYATVPSGVCLPAEPVSKHNGSLRRAAGLLDELLELGSLPIVVTEAAMVADVAGELYHRLRADRMVKVTATAPAVCGFNGSFIRSAA
jgi:hypothetical protein